MQLNSEHKISYTFRNMKGLIEMYLIKVNSSADFNQAYRLKLPCMGTEKTGRQNCCLE